MDWIQDGLEGSLRAGKSKGGRKGVMLNLALPERTVYKLQRLLEEMVAPDGDWFKKREVVLLHEDIRLAVVDCEEQEANREAREKALH